MSGFQPDPSKLTLVPEPAANVVVDIAVVNRMILDGLYNGSHSATWDPATHQAAHDALDTLRRAYTESLVALTKMICRDPTSDKRTQIQLLNHYFPEAAA